MIFLVQHPHPRPIAHCQPQIGQRISQSRHLPVEHGLHAIPRRMHHYVVQLIVVVHQGGLARSGHPIGKPADHAIHLCKFFRLRVLPPLRPTPHLPFQKSLGLPQCAQILSRNVDCVQPHQAIDERFAHQPRIIRNRAEIRRHGFSYDNPPPPLHQKERASNHRGILAQQEDSRRFRKMGMNRIENAILARHVMRFRRHRTQRRTSQYKLLPAGPYEINKIRMAVRKLLHFHHRTSAAQPFPQVIGERCGVQTLAWPNRGSVAAYIQSVTHAVIAIIIFGHNLPVDRCVIPAEDQSPASRPRPSGSSCMRQERLASPGLIERQ